MSNFSKGKYARAISDRSGMEFPYREMVTEWNGSFVHISEYEAKHPQLEPKRFTADGQGLPQARPARTETPVPRLLPLNPFTTTASSTTVRVREPNHGRSAGDVVRFRDAMNVGGITETAMNKAAGYTIAADGTDPTNYYTFTSDETATITQTGGGGSASAGPVTVQN